MTEDKTNILTNVDYWLNIQKVVSKLPEGGVCPTWFGKIENIFVQNPKYKCLEIGAFPGTTLLFLAKQFNFNCTGIDFSERIQTLSTAFLVQGISANFIQEDFLEWDSPESFDFVYSCGFIEHFKNYPDVVKKHWTHVKPGGYMLLTVPALTPFQFLIRKICYRKSRMKLMLDSHNIKIMNLNSLKRTVLSLENIEIQNACYFSEFKIWLDINDPDIRNAAKPFLKIVLRITGLLNRLNMSNRFFSPEALVLVRKKKHSFLYT